MDCQENILINIFVSSSDHNSAWDLNLVLLSLLLLFDLFTLLRLLVILHGWVLAEVVFFATDLGVLVFALSLHLVEFVLFLLVVWHVEHLKDNGL